MLGAPQGFTAWVKQVNPNVQVVYCLPHCENLAAQHLSLELSIVMQEVVAVVNFIKSSAVNSHLFKTCVNLRSEFQHLLFYSNVRWLSCSKLLHRVVYLQTEVQIIFNKKNHHHAIWFKEVDPQNMLLK